MDKFDKSKTKKVTITLDEFAQKFSDTVTDLIKAEPAFLILTSELAMLGAILGHKLFDFDEEKGEENGKDSEGRNYGTTDCDE